MDMGVLLQVGIANYSWAPEYLDGIRAAIIFVFCVIFLFYISFCVLFTSLSVFQDCQYMIAHSIFSNIYTILWGFLIVTTHLDTCIDYLSATSGLQYFSTRDCSNFKF